MQIIRVFLIILSALSKMVDIDKFIFPPCATDGCRKAIAVGLNYNRLGNVAFIKDCNCHTCPLICHQCRSQAKKMDKVICRWCRNPGLCYTIRPDDSDWEKTIPLAVKWFYFRNKIRERRTRNYTILANFWNKFSLFSRLNPSPRITKQWLRAQMFYESTLPVVYLGLEQMSSSLFFEILRVSFARTLVCKLLNESGNHVMFRQGYCRKFLPIFQQKMFAKILRHVISNIVHLHELSIELHKQ
jgi:hypothetical protein